MKKSLTIGSVLVLAFLCFVISTLAVYWWNSPKFQVYIPPKSPSVIDKILGKPLFNVKIHGKKGCIDGDGNIIIEPKFEDIQCSEDKLLPIKADEKWGFVNQVGEVILEPQFSLSPTGYSKYFSEDLGVVCQNQKCGYIDLNGNYAIEPKFDYAENFSDGLAKVNVRGFEFLGYTIRNPQVVFINKQGEFLFKDSDFTAESKFSNGLAKVSVDEKAGFIDELGKFVINPQETWIDDFHEDLAVTSTGNGNNFRLGYIDKTGKVVIPLTFKQAGEFSEGLANIMFENGKYGYIDKAGKTVIEPQFDVADTFYDDRAVVMIGTRKGYVDKTGKRIIPIQFGSAERFVNGLARVSFDDENPPYENKKYGYINKSGNFVWQPSNENSSQ